MVINALFTHASCCLLLWLGLIKRDIAKEALFAHCGGRKRSYFVVKDFSLFFFGSTASFVGSMDPARDAIRNGPLY